MAEELKEGLTIDQLPERDVLTGNESILFSENGSEGRFKSSILRGPKGESGPSAYDTAVANGFVGTESEWLESLEGKPGEPGKSLTFEDLTVEQKEELKGADGADGKSAYQLAVDNGFDGTEQEWLDSLKGTAEEGGGTKDFYLGYHECINGLRSFTLSEEEQQVLSTFHTANGLKNLYIKVLLAYETARWSKTYYFRLNLTREESSGSNYYEGVVDGNVIRIDVETYTVSFREQGYVSSETVYSKTEIDNKIGDISNVLDSINGEAL